MIILSLITKSKLGTWMLFHTCYARIAPLVWQKQKACTQRRMFVSPRCSEFRAGLLSMARGWTEAPASRWPSPWPKRARSTVKCRRRIWRHRHRRVRHQDNGATAEPEEHGGSDVLLQTTKPHEMQRTKAPSKPNAKGLRTAKHAWHSSDHGGWQCSTKQKNADFITLISVHAWSQSTTCIHHCCQNNLHSMFLPQIQARVGC